MKSTFNVMSVNDLITMTVSGKLNPDPISQRPAVSSGHKKSQEIVAALIEGLGVGMITARDISGNEEMQKIYPGVQYLIIDGGHRIRSFVEYFRNVFKVNGSFFKENENTDNDHFLNIKIPFESVVCTSSEATRIFRTRNKTTGVNFIEMIMCDDESPICREVRSRTKYYKEYGNNPLPIFKVYHSVNGEVKNESFDGEPNPRRKWDEYVFIAILKAIGGGNVDAGQREIEALVHGDNSVVTKKVLSVVDRFFSDVDRFRDARGRKLNGDIFAAYQVVWFALYEKNPEFVISNHTFFRIAFMEAYTKCTGTSNTVYNNKFVNVSDNEFEEMVNYKEYIRANIKNFSNSKVQRKCAEFLLEEMGREYGVTFRETKRSVSTSQREELLALQGYKCAIDGLPLTLADSVLGHDTAWAKGGQLKDGAVIRKEHNRDMGSTTLDEYRMILNMRLQTA